MAKIKMSKKATSIDMTAMCDVAFLLLTFFILTATAKQPEPLPVQTPPNQPAKVEPASGVAVRVTIVPALYVFKQMLPQLMPVPVIVPVPVPLLLAVSVYC